MITIEQVEVRRKGGVICRVDALEVAAGERLAVIGANGSGKTTLLTVIAGLNRPYDGRCDVSVPVADRIYVHQRPYLFRGTVLFNAAYGLRARGVPKAEAHERAARWLRDLGIPDHGDRGIDNLSGGERRRVALARAFAVAPRLLLLDEPLADLDEAGAALVRAAIGVLTEVTIVIASPSPGTAELAGRAYDLRSPNAASRDLVVRGEIV